MGTIDFLENVLIPNLFQHGGESHDFRGLKMADSCLNPSIQVRLSWIFPLILIRLAWGLKQIPRKNESNMPIFIFIQTKTKLKSY